MGTFSAIKKQGYPRRFTRSIADRKCRHINQQIGHIVSLRSAQIAQNYSADAIVFENLKGWKPTCGKKRSTLKQRFHVWLKSLIVETTRLVRENQAIAIEDLAVKNLVTLFRQVF